MIDITSLTEGAGLSDGAEKREESGSATFARHLPVADEIIVIIWLRRARREVLKVRSRGDAVRPRTGVSSTRSPGSPNPLGLHPREGVGNESRSCAYQSNRGNRWNSSDPHKAVIESKDY